MATLVQKLESSSQFLTILLRHTSDTVSTPVQTELDLIHESVSSLSSALSPFKSQPGIVITSISYVLAISKCSLKPQPPAASINNQKFNLMIYDLHESPRGTHNHKHMVNDFEAAESLISPPLTSYLDHFINNIIRLGKYSGDKNRPPLVKHNRSCGLA